MKKQSPIGRILELGERERGKLIVSVILAVVGVICGMVPYYAAAQIIVRLLAGQNAFAAYLPWLMRRLSAFFCAPFCITERTAFRTRRPLPF